MFLSVWQTGSRRQYCAPEARTAGFSLSVIFFSLFPLLLLSCCPLSDDWPDEREWCFSSPLFSFFSSSILCGTTQKEKREREREEVWQWSSAIASIEYHCGRLAILVRLGRMGPVERFGGHVWKPIKLKLETRGRDFGDEQRKAELRLISSVNHQSPVNHWPRWHQSVNDFYIFLYTSRNIKPAKWSRKNALSTNWREQYIQWKNAIINLVACPRPSMSSFRRLFYSVRPTTIPLRRQSNCESIAALKVQRSWPEIFYFFLNSRRILIHCAAVSPVWRSSHVCGNRVNSPAGRMSIFMS